MKKFLTILLVLVMSVSCIGMNAYAQEETSEMVPVVVQVPDSWGGPHLWAWADDGTNAFAAWPGEAMTALDDGWYYGYVPSFVQNIIVNANNDTDAPVQTEGLIVEAGKGVWITVAEDATAEVSYEAKNTAEIPAYVETFTVHAYVPLTWETVNMWAWSAPDGTNAFTAWPGEALTEGDDGWFTGKAPTWVNSLIINGNEGSVQTEDIAIEGKELWVTVYEDCTYELAYEDPEKAAEDITIYAQVPSDWLAPNCWAWSAPDGTNAFTAWPGEALTLEGDWYTITAPGWINSVIINANDGSVQTGDLSVEAGKDVWVVVADAENATVSYEAPTGDTADDTDADDTAQTEDTSTVTEDVETEEGNNMVLWIVCGVVAASLIGVIVVVCTKKKKTN